MKTSASTVKNFIFDLLFPRFCVGCQKEGTWLCPSCQDKIILIKSPACIICNKLDPHGLCPKHRPALHISSIYPVGYYSDPILKSLIHSFKYDGAKDILEILGPLITNLAKNRPLPKNPILIPVPLSYSRLCERGFNQSELLAQYLSQALNISVSSNTLKRTRHTKPQAEFKRRERLKNIIDSFTVTDPSPIKNKNIILIDDVVTTSATIGECAKALKRAGVKKITVLTLAHG